MLIDQSNTLHIANLEYDLVYAAPISARMPGTTNKQSMSEMESGMSRVVLVLNTRGGTTQDYLVGSKKKKEECIKRGYPCEPYAKCCHSCVVDPIYGFKVCS